MAIKLTQGFNITSSNPIDTRMTLTKAEMLGINVNVMPDKYICVCKDDGKLYIYDKTATPSEETGYFVLYENRLDIPAAITASMSTTEGKAAVENAVAQTLPGAMKDALADETLGQELVDNMFNSEHFEVGLDNKIDLSISLIQAITNN